MSIRRPLVTSLAALAVLSAATACSSGNRSPWGTRQIVDDTPALARPAGNFQVNRGDWIIGKETGVWIVNATPQGLAAPKRIGYVTSSNHREVRGGPAFEMYEVTALDRKTVVGSIDSLGNAVRFTPVRNTVEAVPVGNNSLALSVQAIFDLITPVTLAKTTERELAAEAVFNSYDHNGNGLIERDEKDLDKNEYPSNPADVKRFIKADANKDGRLDRTEFEATLDF
jgi:Ca2+-binding EF-hand superfamily protein